MNPNQSGSENSHDQRSNRSTGIIMYSGFYENHGPEQEPSESNSEPDKTTAETGEATRGLRREEVEMLEREHASAPIVTQDSVDRDLIAQFMDAEPQTDMADPLLQELLASMNEHAANGDAKVNGEEKH